ncbi:MAG: F0F1 ATP synthase subunit A [Candidatus Midichloria sp.]|nr:MAG: F0F1 ATP synthase subunit A [Candidatus Midichloria sp.]
MIINPLKQFAIKNLFEFNLLGFNIHFTNSALTMIIVISLAALLLCPVLFNKDGQITKTQAFIEIIYDTITQMIEGTAGAEARKFAPLIFSLFIFVLSCNLFGMIPYSFTVTSHISITFALAAVIFIFITTLGFIKHGTHFLSLFLPKGVPIFMAPLLIIIELFAYLARPISLSIRLAANIIAGHIVLKVLAALTIMVGFLGIFPFALLTILTGFEIFIAVLQAYIFSILTCVYLSDALNLH